MSKEYITLKWGSLKSWNFESERTKALLQRYIDLCADPAGVEKQGSALPSLMIQNDIPEQKQIICDLIDAGDFETVFLDWDGRYVSKQEAKDYVMNYSRR